MRIILFFLALSVALLADFTGKVIGILDGDTIKVLTDSKETIKIRLYGIDCPESKQAFGTVAKKFTGDEVFGKEVTVKVMAKDRYGRAVAMIYHDGGKCLNYEIVQAGLGWCYHQYNKDPKIEELEGKARSLKVGLWKDPAPIAPWEFRKKKLTGNF